MTGDSPALGNSNAFWAHREGDSSSSNISSHMSCSIEGKPSMDSVLRPKQQPDQAQGGDTFDTPQRACCATLSGPFSFGTGELTESS